MAENGEDWAWLNDDSKKAQQKTVISKLHQKIAELETLVTEDVSNNYFKARDMEDDGLDAVSNFDGQVSTSHQSAVGGIGVGHLAGFSNAANLVSKLKQGGKPRF